MAPSRTSASAPCDAGGPTTTGTDPQHRGGWWIDGNWYPPGCWPAALERHHRP